MLYHPYEVQPGPQLRVEVVRLQGGRGQGQGVQVAQKELQAGERRLLAGWLAFLCAVCVVRVVCAVCVVCVIKSMLPIMSVTTHTLRIA